MRAYAFGSARRRSTRSLDVISVKFDVFGRLQLDVVREGGLWVAYRLDLGKRMKLNELAIPPNLDASEIGTYLDDLYHEMGRPGQVVREIE